MAHVPNVLRVHYSGSRRKAVVIVHSVHLIDGSVVRIHCVGRSELVGGDVRFRFRWTVSYDDGVLIGSGTGLGPSRVRPTEREMAAAFASFVSAFAESIQHGDDCGENADLFPATMRAWAVDNADELSALTELVDRSDD